MGLGPIDLPFKVDLAVSQMPCIRVRVEVESGLATDPCGRYHRTDTFDRIIAIYCLTLTRHVTLTGTPYPNSEL